MPMIAANGANFYYELHGQGQPVILIAGYTCDFSSWQLMLGDLSRHFQLLIFDNRAIGRTTDDHASLSTDLMANDVIAIADKLDLQKPHIVGQSMGGTIAQTIAALFPEKISKLCLFTTSAKWRRAMLLGIQSLLQMREKNLDFDFIFEASLPWLFGDAYLNNKDNIQQLKKLILENPYPQSLNDQTRQYQVLKNFDGINQLKKISAQTLVVYGIQDIITLPYESQFISKHIMQSNIIEMDCGHGILLEIPKALSEALTQFLQS